ncbi:MAG: hypothetical protein LBR22_06655 [Desulfovibrio sp.]|jgi:predicted transposase/invertase (TIGR01784 family)|nr:hypothetical protein [Desulfovibrio sp.]
MANPENTDIENISGAERHANSHPETCEIINPPILMRSDKNMWEEFRMYEKSRRDIIAAQAEARDKLVEKGMKMGRKIGRKEGREEAREEGRKSGREEVRKEIIQKLKNNGMPIEQIVKYSGIPMATVLMYCSD